MVYEKREERRGMVRLSVPHEIINFFDTDDQNKHAQEQATLRVISITFGRQYYTAETSLHL